MKIALDSSGGSYAIEHYRPGRVTIRGTVFTASLIVLPTRLVTDWPPRDPDALQASDFDLVRAAAPEVFLLGTGDRQVFPDPLIFAPLMAQAIGYEVMDNAAACRTFNVLLGEDRPAALALIMDPRTPR